MKGFGFNKVQRKYKKGLPIHEVKLPEG